MTCVELALDPSEALRPVRVLKVTILSHDSEIMSLRLGNRSFGAIGLSRGNATRTSRCVWR